jgi:DNA-binding LacI/PurR family transcriptional regulator
MQPGQQILKRLQMGDPKSDVWVVSNDTRAVGVTRRCRRKSHSGVSQEVSLTSLESHQL